MENQSHFPEIQLTFAEVRVLGCLLEKATTTPAYYPLTLSSVQAACNQSSNRNPVVQFDERTVEKALVGLRLKGLALQLQSAGSRSLKYKHTLEQLLELDEAQTAILTVLLLRGVQTAGEIKQRCERMHEFASIEAVEEALQWFLEYPHGPLVARHPVGGGRRVETYQHLLGPQGSEGIVPANVSAEVIELAEEHVWRQRMEQRIGELEETTRSLHALLNQLRADLGVE